jgi:hypothetical protein
VARWVKLGPSSIISAEAIIQISEYYSSYNSVSPDKQAKVEECVADAIKAKVSIPIPLVIENSSPSGIRNLYVELDCASTSKNLQLSDAPFGGSLLASPLYATFRYFNQVEFDTSHYDLLAKLAKFEDEKLQEVDDGRRLSFEWEALQPQRTRLIKPVLYLYSPQSAQLSIRARVYADTLPKPILLHASIDLVVEVFGADVNDVLPNWSELLEREARTASTISSTTSLFRGA